MERRARSRMRIAGVAAGLAALLAGPSPADVRVQDVARLQGQRVNKLFGFGLVVGLDGSGDGGKNTRAKRALMALHGNFHQPVLDIDELGGLNNVTIVAVEADVPDFGAREGERVDVVVSAVGEVKSLGGGRLLTTPLQYAALDPQDPTTQDIFALAGGRIDLVDPQTPTRGVVRGGATLEADFFYSFIDDRYIWLVLDDAKAGWQWADTVARMINYELLGAGAAAQSAARVEASQTPAVAVGPKNVRVEIPPYELARPAGFIHRVLAAPIFETPAQSARVVINRVTNNIAFTGAVTISPTVLQIPGLGTVSVGGGAASGASGVLGLDTENSGGVAFQELLQTLARLQVPPEQMVAAVEHLQRTGTLNAQLVYTE